MSVSASGTTGGRVRLGVAFGIMGSVGGSSDTLEVHGIVSDAGEDGEGKAFLPLRYSCPFSLPLFLLSVCASSSTFSVASTSLSLASSRSHG